MATILEYVDTVGSKTFAEEPFNEVDNLVLAQLSYLDCKGIVPSPLRRQAVTVAQAAQAYFAARTQEEIYSTPSITIPLTPILVKKMAASRRFAGARLSDFELRYNVRTREQFAALRIDLEGGPTYIAFRGTDGTLTGWREDFNMSFMTVPAQRSARVYLERAVADVTGPLVVGGHSKGGNLAVYAAATCAPAIQAKITRVYSNDGPGFNTSVLSADALASLGDKVVRIVPETCIVGALFQDPAGAVTVRSSNAGLEAHSAFTWQVEGTAFARVPQVDAGCARAVALFNEQVRDCSPADRRAFVDGLFDALAAGGAETVEDVAASSPDQLAAIVAALARTDAGFRAVAWQLVAAFAGDKIGDATAPLEGAVEKVAAALVPPVPRHAEARDPVIARRAQRKRVGRAHRGEAAAAAIVAEDGASDSGGKGVADAPATSVAVSGTAAPADGATSTDGVRDAAPARPLHVRTKDGATVTVKGLEEYRRSAGARQAKRRSQALLDMLFGRTAVRGVIVVALGLIVMANADAHAPVLVYALLVGMAAAGAALIARAVGILRSPRGRGWLPGALVGMALVLVALFFVASNTATVLVWNLVCGGPCSAVADTPPYATCGACARWPRPSRAERGPCLLRTAWLPAAVWLWRLSPW